MITRGNVPKNGDLTNKFRNSTILHMAEIYTFIPKQKCQKDNSELEKLRVRLLELHEARDVINREIRYTKDAIILLEKGEQ